MFPNLRLMIVAVLASILGISCALGLFAEFRVSHDSFLRESNASAPLQLGSSDGAPGQLENTAAPFEFRFQAPAPPSPAAVEGAGRAETSDHATVEATPQPFQPTSPQPDIPAVSAAAESAPKTAPDVTSATESAAVAASSDHSGEAPNPAATGSIADQNAQQTTQQDSGQNTKPGVDSDLAAKTPAASPSVGAAAPSGTIAPASAGTAVPENRRRTTPRHRPIIVRRFQRARPAAPMQDFTAVPPFQWAPLSASPSPQPVRRRIIRRVRPARKPVVQTTTPQTTVSNTSPADTPE